MDIEDESTNKMPVFQVDQEKIANLTGKKLDIAMRKLQPEGFEGVIDEDDEEEK